MLIESYSFAISSGNIPSTSVGAIPPGGIPLVVGVLQTSPGTDLTATVEVSVVTGTGTFIFEAPLSPANSIPIVIPCILGGSGISFSTQVTGTDGSYGLLFSAKD